FFGEVAALHRTRRSATVTAVTRTGLLVLDAHDLHVLMDREPRIAEHIREVARARVGGDMVTRKGDLVVEELDETIAQSADSPGPSGPGSRGWRRSACFRPPRFTSCPSAAKSRRRGDVLRQARPIVRPGSGAAKRLRVTRLSRTSTSVAISGTNVTP